MKLPIRHIGIASLLTVFTATAPVLGVGTRHFVVEDAKDFEAGKLEGVAIDSQGVLRAGLALSKLEVTDATSAFASVFHEGVLYVATGSGGKLLAVTGLGSGDGALGKVTVKASVKAIALTSLAVFGGRVIAGAMPGGVLYALDGDRLVEFAKLEGADSVFALAVAPDGGALYAATGPEGKLFRVLPDGTAQVYFDSEQPHLVSVAVGAGKTAKVYAGSSGKAQLYEITAPGRAVVLHDFETTEVRAITAEKDGSVLVIANELKGKPRSDSTKPGAAPGPDHATSSGGSGVLVRVSPDGLVEQLYESKSDTLISLSIDAAGRPVVGTGVEGRIYRMGDHHRSTLLADIDSRQVAGLVLSPKGNFVVGSDPVVVHPIRGEGGSESVWTSAVLDAGLRARFGRLSFDAKGDVKISTRTGQTAEPDVTWSDWSTESTVAGPVKSPKGRYFQVRARLGAGSDAELSRVEVPFVTDNVRAVITKIEAKSPARNEGGTGIKKSGQPLEAEARSTIEVSFKVDNPDEDELRYRVEYQSVGSSDWFDALEPGEVLTKDRFTWKTGDLAEGRYRLRVTASDELSNPPSRALRHSLESVVVLVDNTAPRLERLTVTGRTVTGTAVDGVGPIRRIELRAGGQKEWIPFEPKDGIFDQPSEPFSLDLGSVIPAGPQLVTVRVFDTAGNSAVEHLELR